MKEFYLHSVRPSSTSLGMLIEELRTLADRHKDQGLSRVVLVVVRDKHPRGHGIRVKGMGTGEIFNMRTEGKQIRVVASFELKDVYRYLSLVESDVQS
jgi:hypothetical protein